MTRPATVGDPGFAALKDRVIARTGHHYYADKDEQLAERVAQRMAVLGIATVAAYAARLDDPSAGADEWERIESAITINETFFFRFAEQFAALEQTILPRLIAQRGTDRRLRIWSVGCSTGAEPYSIAILLHRMLGPRLADWRIAILGSDIDADALATARAGLFGRWALRGMAAETRAVLFDAEGERFRLKPHFRAMVRFQRHNMMTLLEPAAAPDPCDFDLILCRNVLIYFRADMATAMVGALAGRLRRDGYLLVGHAEANPGFDRVATAVDAGGVLAYRAHGSTPAAVPGPAPMPVPVTPVRSRPAPKPVRRDPPGPAAPRPIEPPVRHDPVDQYRDGLAADAAGDRAGAERGYRRALYLDGGFAMAHYLLGRLWLAQGRDADGRRSLANAARVAAALPDDAALAEGEGMTAGALVKAVRHALTVSA